MAPSQIDLKEVIPLYLAGQLAPEESEAFERALSESAELRREVEAVLKLKEGLARLKERGELAPLLQRPPRPHWLPYARAAGVAAVLLAALAWFYRPGAPVSVLALSPQQLVSGTHRPPPVLGSYVLARLRDGAAAVTEVQRTGVIEFRVVASAGSPGVSYRAQVSAVDSTASGRIVGQLDTGPTDADGYVTFYLDTGRLAPGDYEVSLAPRMTGSPEPQTDRFQIRLR